MDNSEIGTFLFFNEERAFGFIRKEGTSEDKYLHPAGLRRSGIEFPPSPGTRVRFTMHDFKGRPQVERIEIIESDDLAPAS